jgi:hypothetical protein
MAQALKSRSLSPHLAMEGFVKRIFCTLCLAAVPMGDVLADAPKAKNAKVTLVYQHELPNVPGKSVKGVLVEYGPDGYSPGHTHARSPFIYATVLEGAIRSQINDVFEGALVNFLIDPMGGVGRSDGCFRRRW